MGMLQTLSKKPSSPLLLGFTGAPVEFLGGLTAPGTYRTTVTSTRTLTKYGGHFKASVAAFFIEGLPPSPILLLYVYTCSTIMLLFSACLCRFDFI